MSTTYLHGNTTADSSSGRMNVCKEQADLHTEILKKIEGHEK
jgi:hypothetical protein